MYKIKWNYATGSFIENVLFNSLVQRPIIEKVLIIRNHYLTLDNQKL